MVAGNSFSSSFQVMFRNTISQSFSSWLPAWIKGSWRICQIMVAVGTTKRFWQQIGCRADSCSGLLFKQFGVIIFGIFLREWTRISSRKGGRIKYLWRRWIFWTMSRSVSISGPQVWISIITWYSASRLVIIRVISIFDQASAGLPIIWWKWVILRSPRMCWATFRIHFKNYLAVQRSMRHNKHNTYAWLLTGLNYENSVEESHEIPVPSIAGEYECLNFSRKTHCDRLRDKRHFF